MYIIESYCGISYARRVYRTACTEYTPRANARFFGKTIFEIRTECIGRTKSCCPFPVRFQANRHRHSKVVEHTVLRCMSVKIRGVLLDDGGYSYPCTRLRGTLCSTHASDRDWSKSAPENKTTDFFKTRATGSPRNTGEYNYRHDDTTTFTVRIQTHTPSAPFITRT